MQFFVFVINRFDHLFKINKELQGSWLERCFFRVRPRSNPKLSAEQSETVPEVENQVSHQCIHKSIINLIQNQATFTGGRLSKFYDVWKRLTSDQFILDAISHCHIDFETEPLANTSAVRPQCHQFYSYRAIDY
jgi:hypothetical protein